jgi:hypothetical protein
VHGLLQLGRGMGLQVIAEGIEDLDQAAWLVDHGCAMAQGYAFGRPAPLPSPAEVLMGEVSDTPAEEVAGELLPGTLETPVVPPPRTADPTPPRRVVLATDDTGRFGLFDYLADETDEDD